MLDSSQLRKTILAERNRLTPDQIAEKSTAIQQKLLTMTEIKDRSSIFVYVSFRSEVATLDLVDALIDMGKRVIVPITRVQAKRMDAIHITNRTTDLHSGYCNIPEPREELCLTNEVPAEQVETILLPGSVFDKRGGRFGYGGGYYDRFLAKVPTAARIGLAFDLQIVEKAPLQSHDELLDLVVTESQVIRGNRQI